MKLRQAHETHDKSKEKVEGAEAELETKKDKVNQAKSVITVTRTEVERRNQE
jgi:hypothetical protein